MEEARIWKLIARKLAAEATEEEIKELEDLLRADPEKHFTIETFYQLWHATPVKQTERNEANKLLERTRKQNSYHELNTRQRKVRVHFIKRNFMFKTNLKIAWRNLLKDRQFTFLNLIGLSTGLACVLFIYLWVNDERSVDKFHTNDSRLYQVLGHIKLPDGIHTQENTPGLLAKSMAEEMPEIEQAIAVQPGYGMGVISVGDRHIKAEEQFADKHFFNVFSYTLSEGDKNHVFSDKYNVVLSDDLALKLFHTTKDLIGKTVQWNDNNEAYIISGIFKKPGANSSIQFDLLFSYELFFERRSKDMLSWENSNPSTFIVVRKGTDIEQLNNKISNYLQTKSDKAPLTLSLRKYSDRYLYSTYENGIPSGGRIGYVRLFSIIAIFILIIACINFMNLSTAKAAGRTKEIGIKKVTGATRSTLVAQYLGESGLMVFLSVTIALTIVALFLPQFNAITGKELVFPSHTNFIVALLFISLSTSLIAGSYPALYLSGFSPVNVLKGKLHASPGELWIRKGLVVFQFTLSAVFIVAVLIIYKQMKLVQTINLGYNKDNIISFRNDGSIRKSFQPFMSEIKNIPDVVNASYIGGDLTGNISGSTEKVKWQGKKDDEGIHFMVLDIGYNLMEMLDIKMVNGFRFSHQSDTANSGIILNEAAVAAMGLKDPIGKTVEFWGGSYRIIGIAGNFHFESLYEKVKPCLVRCVPAGNNILVKVLAGNERPALEKVGKLYQKYNQGIPFEYKFLDQDYQAIYRSEERVAILSRYFAGLAIIISCLGLFGLAAFTAQKRQKEIGIRKVVGASVNKIAAMLSKDFLKLVMIAVVIAFPLSGWVMTQWLRDFAYRINIGPGVFVITGAAIFLITLLIVSFQAIKAAIASPVKSLRTE
jgi:putative ABC transport system permease protein